LRLCFLVAGDAANAPNKRLGLQKIQQRHLEHHTRYLKTRLVRHLLIQHLQRYLLIVDPQHMIQRLLKLNVLVIQTPRYIF